MINEILQGDIREVVKTLPDESVNCIVTSPPYFGLRDYGVDDQIGLEDTPEAYVETMTAIFRELRRVLRSDGTCWLVLGDSYAGSNASQGGDGTTGGLNRDGRKESTRIAGQIKLQERLTKQNIQTKNSPTLKPKDLCLIPHRVALALQQDGWWVRSDIPWIKQNAMPGSQSDRPTTSKEYVFLLSKSERYFFDMEAVKRPSADGSGLRAIRESDYFFDSLQFIVANTVGYPESHFAVFPPALIRPCILAGCPAMVCEACGEPWERVVERVKGDGPASYNGSSFTNGKTYDARNPLATVGRGQRTIEVQSLGFQPTCACNAPHVPGVVFDPFFGSGTVGQEAIETGRRWLGCELNPDYIELAKKRIYGSQPALFPAV